MSGDQRIDEVQAAAYTVPTDRPEADGTLAWDRTTVVVVQVRAGRVTGLGYTYGAAATAAVVRDELAGVVTGRDPMDVPACWSAMVAAVRNVGRPGVAGYALSALDVALWDLKARLLGAARDTVPVYGSGGFTTYDDATLAEQLRSWVVEQRIPRVKIKIAESAGAAVGRDLDRMAVARAAVGPDVELYVDANGGYTGKQAVRVSERAIDLDIRWFEEPVSSDDLAGLREVRDQVAPDVAAGEYGSDLYYFRRMCAAGAVDCLQADASRCGGISEWLRSAAVAASYGLQISGHCAPHLHAAVAAAAPNLRHLEWFHDHVRIERLFFDGVLDPTGGAIRPDASAPGHGLTLRTADAQPYRIR